MLRVAVDANALAWGWSGIPKHIDRIARELVKQDVELYLLANTDRPFASIPGARQVFRRRRGGAIWRNTFVRPWLARRAPDVFWAPETVAPLLVPVPTVVTVHDVGPLLLAGIKPRRHHFAFRTAAARSVRGATLVVAVSQTTARDVETLWGVPRTKVRVVPNGVDDRFRPVDRDQATARVRERWGISRPFALFVGTVEPRKGVDLLSSIAAVAEDFDVVLAGAPGFQGTELVLGAAEAGARVLGAVGDDELPDLYCAAEALLAPSLYEGFGLTPLEAMACGTPAVVAAGAGALGEISGPAAIEVESRSPEAWVEAVARAASRRDELAARGLEHVRQFRWPDVARRMRAVLSEAAASAGAADA